jgi:hypothetical protein
MKLTQHFLLSEFARSETAARMGREIEIPDHFIPDIRALCVNILEPFRVDVKRAVFILSGYRPLWLNRKVGGSAMSQHMVGQAADFVVSGMTPIQACRRIMALELPFDQLILEFDRWVHVSYSPAHRRQALTARKVKGKTRYLPGIQEDTP